MSRSSILIPLLSLLLAAVACTTEHPTAALDESTAYESASLRATVFETNLIAGQAYGNRKNWDFNPSLVNDGYTTSGMSGASSVDVTAWMMWEFTTPQTIAKVRLKEPDSGTSQISTWNFKTYSNGVWRTAFGVQSSETSNWQEVTLSPPKDGVERVRLEIAPPAGGNAVVEELEVYGAADDSNPAITTMDFKARIEAADKDVNRLQALEYYTWGGSVTRDHGGTYHMFVSRWRTSLGFAPGWLKGSSIWRATSPAVNGPWTIQEELTVLKNQDWAEKMLHNPTVHKIGSTYYLFYVGTTWRMSFDKNVAQKGQRIGIATASDPAGPWTPYSGNPILTPRTTRWDSTFVSNPAVLVRGADDIVLLYKSRVVVDGKVKFWYGAATATSPLGPYARTAKNRLFDYKVEDAYAWKEGGKYWMILKSMQANLGGVAKGNGVLFESADGLTWILSTVTLAWDHRIEYSDGTTEELNKVERPQIYVEAGVAKCLYNSYGDGKTYAGNVSRLLAPAPAN